MKEAMDDFIQVKRHRKEVLQQTMTLREIDKVLNIESLVSIMPKSLITCSEYVEEDVIELPTLSEEMHKNDKHLILETHGISLFEPPIIMDNKQDGSNNSHNISICLPPSFLMSTLCFSLSESVQHGKGLSMHY